MYPLSQVLVGAVKLVPTPRYFLLHLRLVRALVNLEAATGVLLPVTPLLLDILGWRALSKPGKAGAGQFLQNSLLLRASKAMLASSVFQENVIQQVTSLLDSVRKFSTGQPILAKNIC